MGCKQTELREAEDADDPLGGLLAVWISNNGSGEATDLVEVVNFLNPFSCAPTPAAQAIARAVALEGSHLRCVSLADLVALKLYAGSLSDLADIVQVLALNPDADLETVRTIAGRFDRSGCLDELFAKARDLRGAPRPR